MLDSNIPHSPLLAHLLFSVIHSILSSVTCSSHSHKYVISYHFHLIYITYLLAAQTLLCFLHISYVCNLLRSVFCSFMSATSHSPHFEKKLLLTQHCTCNGLLGINTVSIIYFSDIKPNCITFTIMTLCCLIFHYSLCHAEETVRRFFAAYNFIGSMHFSSPITVL